MSNRFMFETYSNINGEGFSSDGAMLILVFIISNTTKNKVYLYCSGAHLMLWCLWCQPRGGCGFNWVCGDFAVGHVHLVLFIWDCDVYLRKFML